MSCSNLCSTIVSICLFVTLTAACAGCNSTPKTVGLAAGITAAGARTPANEMEQTFYVGIFDPEEQLPPMLYRIRVHGQSSLISRQRFASGWVPAKVIDSLSTNLSFDEDGKVQIENAESEEVPAFATGRRLIMFGPEGFRESPKDHRLVIVMGSDPSDYFNAVDETLGHVAQEITNQMDSAMTESLLRELISIQGEQARLQYLKASLNQIAIAGETTND